MARDPLAAGLDPFVVPLAAGAGPLLPPRPTDRVGGLGPRRVTTGFPQEAQALPAYDDFGEPITRGEIESRMRGGGGGGVLGGILGTLVGGFIGAGIAFEQCGLFENCSPREDAFAGLAVVAGLAWGAVLGGVLGSQALGIDRWEALDRIRAERRAARGGR